MADHSDDETVAKMGHPVVMVRSDVGHPPSLLDIAFQFPVLIEKPRDRNPDVSLLLLESSRLRTNNPAVRDKLSALQSHLMTLYKKTD
jgi:hypothetical protein